MISHLRSIDGGAAHLIDARNVKLDGLPPPQDLEAEGQALGAMLWEPAKIPIGRGILSPEHFYSEPNRLVCEAILACADLAEADARPLSIVTPGLVLAWLKDRGFTQRVMPVTRQPGETADEGTGKYLQRLQLHTPGVWDFACVCERVRDKARERAVIREGWNILAEAYRGHAGTTQQWLDDAVARLRSVAATGKPLDLATIGEATEEAIRIVTTNSERTGGIVGLSTGLERLDNETGGMQPGDLWLVTGPKGGGKTAFALQLALQTASRTDDGGEPRDGVYFWSGEMPKRALGLRASCREAFVDAGVVRNTPRDLTPEQWSALMRAAEITRLMPVLVDERKNLHCDVIQSSAHSTREHFARRGKRLALVVLDYYQLTAAPPDLPRTANRTEQLEHTGKAFVQLAEELQVPVVLLAQTRKDGAISYCTGLEAHIHNWIDLRNFKPGKSHEKGEPIGGSLRIKKQRGSATGAEVPVWFHGHLQRFTDEEWIIR